MKSTINKIDVSILMFNFNVQFNIFLLNANGSISTYKKIIFLFRLNSGMAAPIMTRLTLADDLYLKILIKILNNIKTIEIVNDERFESNKNNG